jgi:hypothetical protein
MRVSGPGGGSITYDALAAIVSHAVRLPFGVEVQGFPEFQASAVSPTEVGLQRLF